MTALSPSLTGRINYVALFVMTEMRFERLPGSCCGWEIVLRQHIVYSLSLALLSAATCRRLIMYSVACVSVCNQLL